MNAAEIGFHHAVPIVHVRDLAASVAHYTNVLGFKVDWHDLGLMAGVSRGSCHLMICEGDQGHPGGWVWIGVSDAGALEAELRAKGAKIRHPATNYPWAFEVQVEDIDGNLLRFGSDEKPDEPAGEWLDGNGVRWELRPEGGWKRVDGA
jgi:catechol 2,3-dioxygenase-like lactoylglutathione lyase family enzyme